MADRLGKIRLFVTAALDGGAAVPPKPAERLDRILSALNCYACHDRDGKGGHQGAECRDSRVDPCGGVKSAGRE